MHADPGAARSRPRPRGPRLDVLTTTGNSGVGGREEVGGGWSITRGDAPPIQYHLLHHLPRIDRVFRRALLRRISMSYSLMLVRVPTGTSDDEEVEKIAHAVSKAEDARRPGPPDPETERQKRALVEALLAECPELEGGEVDHVAIARAENISEEDARHRYHWWQVSSPEEGAAIEITLYDSYISIDASRVGTDEDWEDLWQYLEILVREGGFVVWDPQGPNVVDLAAGPSGDGKRKKRPKPVKRRGSRTRGAKRGARR